MDIRKWITIRNLSEDEFIKLSSLIINLLPENTVTYAETEDGFIKIYEKDGEIIKKLSELTDDSTILILGNS